MPPHVDAITITSMMISSNNIEQILQYFSANFDNCRKILKIRIWYGILTMSQEVRFMQWMPDTNQKFYYSNDLQRAGLSYYQIRKLTHEGILIRRGNKVYENLTYSGEESDFMTVSAYIPKGIICMMTAARFYGLTSYLPDAIDVAIQRSKKISTFPEWPAVQIWYFPDDRYMTGIVTVPDQAASFRMYDQEKTIVDILYYRNKVGIEETKEILKKYLARSDRNLIELHRYAEMLGCGKILSTYLEVLL